MRRSERLAAKHVLKEAENVIPSLPSTPSFPPMTFTNEQLAQTFSGEANPIFSPGTLYQILNFADAMEQQGLFSALPSVSLTELSAQPTPKIWSYPIAAAPPPPPLKGKRKKNAPYPPPKPKAPKRRDNWHVITASPEVALAQDQVGRELLQQPSTIVRKDAFKTYEKPPEREEPKWAKIYTREEMEQYPEAKVKEMDYGPHSDMGWVLARIREPNCGARGRYGWAIAEVNEPRESKYLVLSGPHAKKVLFVREFDRRAYSPEAIEELRTENARKPIHLRDNVYDTITHDVAELIANSSAYGTASAVQGFDAIPRGDETEFWRSLNPSVPYDV